MLVCVRVCLCHIVTIPIVLKLRGSTILHSYRCCKPCPQNPEGAPPSLETGRESVPTTHPAHGTPGRTRVPRRRRPQVASLHLRPTPPTLSLHLRPTPATIPTGGHRSPLSLGRAPPRSSTCPPILGGTPSLGRGSPHTCTLSGRGLPHPTSDQPGRHANRQPSGCRPGWGGGRPTLVTDLSPADSAPHGPRVAWENLRSRLPPRWTPSHSITEDGETLSVVASRGEALSKPPAERAASARANHPLGP